MTLNPIEVRVLGALIEKEIATPEAYPLSLNALLNACNQRSSREPVMELDEEQVRQSLHLLEDKQLVSVVRDGRVAKFEHRARTVLTLRRDETAVLCLLLLRGPQTPGELRSRADRLYTFDDLEAVESTLKRLAIRTPPSSSEAESDALAVLLPRQPGSREARWAHLLGGPMEASNYRQPESAASSRAQPEVSSDTLSRLEAVEAELVRLRHMVAVLDEKINQSNSSSFEGAAG
ncbi:MAG: YceH family protein [Acidobacteriaceae bacterium]